MPLPFPSPKRRICHGQTSVRPSQLSSKITQLAFRTSPRTRLPYAAHQNPSTLHRPPRTALPSRLPCTGHPPASQPVYPGPPTQPVYPGPPTKARPPEPSTPDRPPPSRLPRTAHPEPSTLCRPPSPSTLGRPPPGQVPPSRAVYPGPTSVPSTWPSPSRAVYPGPAARQGRKGRRPLTDRRSKHPRLSLSSPRKARRRHRRRALAGKSRRRRAYPQQIVTTRLLYCLQDPFAQLSRLQRI